MSARKFEDLINPNGTGDLDALVRRARELGELASALARALPADLGADVLAANVRPDGELVVVCRTPARAARLRYEGRTLLAAASSAGENVNRVTVRVARA